MSEMGGWSLQYERSDLYDGNIRINFPHTFYDIHNNYIYKKIAAPLAN